MISLAKAAAAMHITQQPNASNADTDDNTSATAIKNNGTHYFPLQKNEIRVLEVLPGGEHDDVQCRLEHVLVNNPPEFNALSYTWGDPQAPKVTISVDGYDLLVTKSCKSILQELRRESMAQSKPQFIWIDAICINQSDIVERNIQVQVMGEVYRNAKKLIVWLGAEDNDIREVIEIMNELSGSPAQGAFEDWWHLHFQMHPRFLERCFAMLIFFSYPWFTRVWVIQEYVIFAQSHRKQGGKESIEFYCGRTRLESSTLLYLRRAGLLHHLLRTLETEKNLGKEEGDIALSLVTKSFHRGFVCFDRILERTRRRSPLMSKAATATELLGCIVGGLECGWTEPRDRIYAYLGILEYRRWECERDVREVHKLVRFEAISSMQAALDNLNNTEFDKQMAIVGQVFEFANLIINYDAPIEDVYSSFVSYVVLATGSLNVLSLCHRRSIYVQRTWTVDLTTIPLFIQGTKQGGGLLNRSLGHTLRHESFRASKNSAAATQFSSDLSVLSVRGFRYTTISRALGPDILGFWESVFHNRISTKSFLDQLVHLKICKTPEDARSSVWNIWLGGHVFETESLQRPELFRNWCDWIYSETEAVEIDVIKEWMSASVGQYDRTFFVTKNMMLVKGWRSVKDGDIVSIILGCDVPLVLREVGLHFELIGDCYTNGIMEGQAMKELQDGKVKLETFDLH